MLNQHESYAATYTEVGKKVLDSIKPSSGWADAHDRYDIFLIRAFLTRIIHVKISPDFFNLLQMFAQQLVSFRLPLQLWDKLEQNLTIADS